MFLCVTFGGVFNFIDGLGKETGLGAQITFFFVIFVILMITVRPLSGEIFDKKGHAVLILPASLLGAIGLLLLAKTENLTTLLAAAVFYSIGYAIIQPTLQAWAVCQVSADKKGTATL